MDFMLGWGVFGYEKKTIVWKGVTEYIFYKKNIKENAFFGYRMNLMKFIRKYENINPE